jgi:putative tryptophan/tyrosine transport system substrate-binding protein
MRRRDFIAALGGAAGLAPFGARAQHSAMPVVGFLDARSPDAMVSRLRAWHQGLRDSGYVEGENVIVVYRWAEGRFDRLPQLAADLVRRQVGVIALGGGVAPARAVKAATATIPIVFAVPEDPVGIGLVASLSRPGGNMTGVNYLTTELVGKRLELLRELLPAAALVAVISNPDNPNTKPTLRDVEAAAQVMKLEIRNFSASTSQDIDKAFAMAARERPDAVFLGGDAFFLSRRLQIATLAIRHALPSVYSQRDFVEVGGLLSYAADTLDAYRQSGVYVGRILKGAKPEELPVLQSTRFELVINNQTARTLGITVTPSLLSRADEVIE